VKGLAPGGGSWQACSARGARELRDWAFGLLPAEGVAALRSAADVRELLGRCGAGAKGRGRAAWRLCAVLVSDKAGAAPPALLRSLAARYAGQVALGLAPRGGAAAQALLGAQGGGGKGKSQLVLVCNGDAATRRLFEGELKGEALARALDGYAGGGKCSAMVPLSAGMDFGALPAGQLRRILQERGVGCRGCADRSDFEERLRQHLREQEEEEAGGGGAAREEL
jgi:hypothetical protein